MWYNVASMSNEHTNSPQGESGRKRLVPKAPGPQNMRGGWIVLLSVATVLIAMRFFGPSTVKPVQDISQAEFISAIESNAVERVERVRMLESGSTYLSGHMRGKESDNVGLEYLTGLIDDSQRERTQVEDFRMTQ